MAIRVSRIIASYGFCDCPDDIVVADDGYVRGSDRGVRLESAGRARHEYPRRGDNTLHGQEADGPRGHTHPARADPSQHGESPELGRFAGRWRSRAVEPCVQHPGCGQGVCGPRRDGAIDRHREGVSLPDGGSQNPGINLCHPLPS